MKQSFSVNDLLEDIGKLSTVSSGNIQKVYSDFVSSMVRLAAPLPPPGGAPVDNSASLSQEFGRNYIVELDYLIGGGFDNDVGNEGRRLLSSDLANIGTILNADFAKFSAAESLPSYNKRITAVSARYAAYLVCAAIYSKREDSKSSDVKKNLLELSGQITKSIHGLVKSRAVRLELERIVAKGFGANIDDIFAFMNINTNSEQFSRLKTVLLPEIEPYLVTLLPNFKPYVEFIQGNTGNLENRHGEFKKLYNQYKNMLDGSGPITAGINNCLKPIFSASEGETEGDFSTNPGFEPFDKTNEESANPEAPAPNQESAVDKSQAENQPIDEDSLRKFVRDFDPTGESFIRLGFLGQAIIDKGTAHSATTNAQGTVSYYNDAKKIIMEEIRGHTGNSYSKLALAMTILYQLSH